MAGPFTHWMIAEEALKQLAPGPQNNILQTNRNFLLLGAVSPDLPYLSVGSSKWADLFHKPRTRNDPDTNAIPLAFLEYFKDRGSLGHELVSPQFAWTMGYLSHMVADATIHPIVEATVGKLPENKVEHTACEMAQDSLVFFQLKQEEITSAEYSDLIESCRGSEGFFLLMDNWRDFIQAAYNDVDALHPRDWFSNYVNAIDVADGGTLHAFSRQYPELESMFYKSARELRSEHPESVSRYFNDVSLPDGGRGPFMAQGFYPAVSNVVNIWQEIYSVMEPGRKYGQWVRNWDLDTGTDLDSPSLVRTYWA